MKASEEGDAKEKADKARAEGKSLDKSKKDQADQNNDESHARSFDPSNQINTIDEDRTANMSEHLLGQTKSQVKDNENQDESGDEEEAGGDESSDGEELEEHVPEENEEGKTSTSHVQKSPKKSKVKEPKVYDGEESMEA